MEMSLGDDGATAASPPTEKGAWYESGLLPGIEVDGNLLECPADGQVKPIVGSALAAQRGVCDESSLPFAAESQSKLAEVEHDALEKHLVLAYKALVHDDDASRRRNIVAYLAARCEVSHVANVVVNSSFVTLLLKLARRRDGDAALRRQLLVLLGLLVRHATYVVPDAADDAALAPTLARVATDGDADPATRCLALAALGELLFYVATQDDDDEDSLEQSDAWRVDPAHARCVVDHVTHDHAELVKFTVQEGKLEEFVAQLKPIVKEYSQLPGVLSLTFAQTSANEIRSCAVYDSMASLEANGPALKETLAGVVPLLAEGGFERAVGEVVVEA